MAVKVFEELEVWKEARRLTQRIYQLTKNENFSKDFALRDQIRRAAVSVISPKASSAAAIKNSFNFFTLPRLHVAK
jgi:four helix bundle protein